MKTYIGVKMIQATPSENEAGEAGYKLYPDGYANWSPKEAFEKAYLPIELDESITPKDIDSMLAKVQTSDADEKTTIVRAELLTGFSLFETASCVSPENYDQARGTEISINKIREKLWFALGFVLQWARYGLKHTPVELAEAPKEGANNGNPQ